MANKYYTDPESLAKGLDKVTRLNTEALQAYGLDIRLTTEIRTMPVQSKPYAKTYILVRVCALDSSHDELVYRQNPLAQTQLSMAEPKKGFTKEDLVEFFQRAEAIYREAFWREEEVQRCLHKLEKQMGGVTSFRHYWKGEKIRVEMRSYLTLEELKGVVCLLSQKPSALLSSSSGT